MGFKVWGPGFGVWKLGLMGVRVEGCGPARPPRSHTHTLSHTPSHTNTFSLTHTLRKHTRVGGFGCGPARAPRSEAPSTLTETGAALGSLPAAGGRCLAARGVSSEEEDALPRRAAGDGDWQFPAGRASSFDAPCPTLEEEEDALPRRAAGVAPPPGHDSLRQAGDGACGEEGGASSAGGRAPRLPWPVSRCGGARGRLSTSFEAVLSAHSLRFFPAGSPPVSSVDSFRIPCPASRTLFSSTGPFPPPFFAAPAMAACAVGAVEVRAASPDRSFATPVAFLP